MSVLDGVFDKAKALNVKAAEDLRAAKEAQRLREIDAAGEHARFIYSRLPATIEVLGRQIQNAAAVGRIWLVWHSPDLLEYQLVLQELKATPFRIRDIGYKVVDGLNEGEGSHDEYQLEIYWDHARVS